MARAMAHPVAYPMAYPMAYPNFFKFTSYKEKNTFLPVQGSSAGKKESILSTVSIKQGLRTTDYGLGIKQGLGYKTRTKHYGLGIKYGLGYKTRTEHYGLGIKHLEKFYIESSLARTSS